MPVAVEVGPGGGLRGDRLAQAGGDRHVGEPAISFVAQQRGPSGVSHPPRSSRTSRSPSLS